MNTEERMAPQGSNGSTDKLTDTPTDDYDSPWKDIIHSAFPEFMAFFFAEAAARIDWAAGHEFLDTELRQVVQDAELGRRHADVLVRVTTLDGATGHVFVHVEVQGGRESDFARRMFTYHYRLFDRFSAPVASFAVLADEDPAWRPDHFSFEALGLEHTVQFGIAKLLDHEHRIDELTSHPNPFALVTAAHLLTRRTRGDDLLRYQAKLRLIRLLYRQGWARPQVLELFSVLDWMMRLPKDLKEQLWQDIDALDEEKRMAFVNTWEERGIEKGIEKGIQLGIEQGLEQGLEQGIEKGRTQGQADLLARQLTRRFGPLPDDIHHMLASAAPQQLATWADRVLDAISVDQVFGTH